MSNTSEVIPLLLHTKVLHVMYLFGHFVGIRLQGKWVPIADKCKGEQQWDGEPGNPDLQGQKKTFGGFVQPSGQQRGGVGGVLSCSEGEWNNLPPISTADGTQNYGKCHYLQLQETKHPAPGHSVTPPLLEGLRKRLDKHPQLKPALGHGRGALPGLFSGFLFDFLNKAPPPEDYFAWMGGWCSNSLPQFSSGSLVDLAWQRAPEQGFPWLSEHCEHLPCLSLSYHRSQVSPPAILPSSAHWWSLKTLGKIHFFGKITLLSTPWCWRSTRKQNA